jgi:hypothetical protein
MNSMVRIITAGVFASFAALAGARDERLLSIDEAATATASENAQRQIGEIMLAPIRSQAELNDFVVSNPQSALNSLTPTARERFFNSLTFNSIGLTGFGTTELEALQPREAYAILSLFGAQSSVGQLHFDRVDNSDETAMGLIRPDTDYPGYRCAPPATCIMATASICLGTCARP